MRTTTTLWLHVIGSSHAEANRWNCNGYLENKGAEQNQSVLMVGCKRSSLDKRELVEKEYKGLERCVLCQRDEKI